MVSDDEIIERLEILSKRNRVPGYKIAEAIGQGPQWWSDIRNPEAGVKHIKAKDLPNLAEVLRTSVEYLVTGNNAEKGPETYTSNEEKLNGILRKRGGVPVSNKDFTAGDVTQFDDEREKVIGYVDLEGFRKCIWIVRVKGTSMKPDFMTGDFVGLEPVEDRKIIQYGQPYAITTKDGQKMIKIIRKGKDNEHLILRSKNREEHDDIDIHKDDIGKLFKVHGPIRDQWQ